jgi:hypothetical protein
MKRKVGLLTASEIAALTSLYWIYRKKKKVERKVVEGVFYRATGKRLGTKYYGIPIVRRLLELQG